MDYNPILILDDDEDDLEMISEAAKELKLNNPIILFNSGDELEQYLRSDKKSPFLVICDLNMPQYDGFALRQRISENKDTKYKSVPFMFWSTSASEKQIQYAYDLPVQGFFFKPNNFTDLCDTLKTIVHYWQKSQHPKEVK